MRVVRTGLAGAFLAAVTLCARAGAPPSGPVVHFDQGHGQKFLVGGKGALDLSGFAGIVRAKGATVRAGSGAVVPAALSDVQILVISGAFKGFTPQEAEAVVAWVDAGGRLAVMIHVEPPQADLLHRLGVSVSNGVIREREDVVGKDPLNFNVTRIRPHALTKGVESFSMYGAWALLPTVKTAEPVAVTGPRSWVDLNRNGKFEKGDAVQSFAVLVVGRVGKGRFAVFGDDALFQNRFLKGGNRRLAENLVDWLLGDGADVPGPRSSHG